jgi:hypothetical protein
MNRLGLASVAGLCLVMSLPAGTAVAQQKQQVSFKVPAENIKYGVQQNVAVGDELGHIVRVFGCTRPSLATHPSSAGSSLPRRGSAA